MKADQGLSDRLRAAGASDGEVDAFYEMVALGTARPEAAMLRLISDICHGTRFRDDANPRAVASELGRVHGVIRRLAEVFAAPRRQK